MPSAAASSPAGTTGGPATGADIPVGATVSAINGNMIALSLAPTGTVSGFVTPGYAEGTVNDQDAAIATLDNPANWTVANYGANIVKANLTDDGSAISGTLAGATTINSLRFNAAAAHSVALGTYTLTLTSGGLLETANVGAHAVTISGTGTLTTGNSQDVIVTQDNPSADMTVSAGLTGTRGLTKSGAGRLVVNGVTSYSGTTTLNAGTLALGGSSTVGNGSSAVTAMPGSILDLSGSSAAQTFGSLSSVSVGGGRRHGHPGRQRADRGRQ